MTTEPNAPDAVVTPGGLVDPASVETITFDWGYTKWFVEPVGTPGAGLSFGEIVVLPGLGHTRHNHPGSEEILYVLSGEGEQTVDDGPPFTVRSGDTVYIGAGVFHSTMNTGWEPMRVLALYNPAGPERDLITLPDARVVPAGEVAKLARG